MILLVLSILVYLTMAVLTYGWNLAYSAYNTSNYFPLREWAEEALSAAFLAPITFPITLLKGRHRYGLYFRLERPDNTNNTTSKTPL